MGIMGTTVYNWCSKMAATQTGHLLSYLLLVGALRIPTEIDFLLWGRFFGTIQGDRNQWILASKKITYKRSVMRWRQKMFYSKLIMKNLEKTGVRSNLLMKNEKTVEYHYRGSAWPTPLATLATLAIAPASLTLQTIKRCMGKSRHILHPSGGSVLAPRDRTLTWRTHS